MKIIKKIHIKLTILDAKKTEVFVKKDTIEINKEYPTGQFEKNFNSRLFPNS